MGSKTWGVDRCQINIRSELLFSLCKQMGTWNARAFEEADENPWQVTGLAEKTSRESGRYWRDTKEWLK
jgi:hypothetical protein